MKRKASELARIARDMLNRRYTIPMGAFVTASLIPAVLEIPFSLFSSDSPSTMQVIVVALAEFLITLIEQVLFIGVLKGHLELTRNHPFKIKMIFSPFTAGTDRFFGAVFLFDFMMIPLLCPGIASYLYLHHAGTGALTVTLFVLGCLVSAALLFWFFIHYLVVFCFLLEYPQMKVLAAFRECRLAMRGHKKCMASILFRFTGWICLIACSFGIASLWAVPHMIELLTVFYLDLTGELDRIPVRNYHTASGGFANPFI